VPDETAGEDARAASMNAKARALLFYCGTGVLAWTRKLPESRGWYWWRNSGQFHDPVYWDVYYVNEAGYIGELQSSVNNIKALHPDSEWAGPIHPPLTV
jgi:hypothetical protein